LCTQRQLESNTTEPFCCVQPDAVQDDHGMLGWVSVTLVPTCWPLTQAPSASAVKARDDRCNIVAFVKERMNEEDFFLFNRSERRSFGSTKDKKVADKRQSKSLQLLRLKDWEK
jgi:hypothetical protein